MTARSLLARVLVERRGVLLPLGIAALVNVGVYSLVYYRLSLKVAASERRAAAARTQLQAAERDEKSTRAALGRAEQASADLKRFYRETLPTNVEGARRMSYAKLASLADRHGLAVERRSYDRDSGYRGNLSKLNINMTLSGEYRDIREFLHELETSPEFLVIEDVSLTEGKSRGAPLSVGVQLATYFAGARDGA
jgi:Tfp pilus assembly protein PilO